MAKWPQFVVDDIPAWLADRVAREVHQRRCGSFDGARNRALPPPTYSERHQVADMGAAAAAIASLCSALGIAPVELERLARAEPNQELLPPDFGLHGSPRGPRWDREPTSRRAPRR